MRKMTWILGLFVGGLFLADLAIGQQFGGLGGGFGVGGGKGLDAYALVSRQDVKKELEITDDQTAAIHDAVLKALGNVLNDKQFKRLQQIELQQRGARAFADPKIQAALKMTGAQKENVKTILDDNKKEQAELLPAKGKGGAGFGKGNAENVEKLQNLQKETLEKLNGMLTAEQKTTWKGLNGDTFKLETPAFGGAGNFGKGKGKNKKE
jgi:hypothetical protein